MRPRAGDSSSVSGIARHGRLKKSGPLRGILALIGTIVAVIVVSSLVDWRNCGLSDGFRAWTRGGHPSARAVAPPPNIGVYPGGFNILIVGDDTRAGQGGIGVGPGDGGALNDVDDPAARLRRPHLGDGGELPARHGRAASAVLEGRTGRWPADQHRALYGGLACVVTVIEAFTGSTIQFAGLITFDGVIDMSDAVGGVTCAPQDR